MDEGTKEKFYISLGIWISLVPFLGIPGAWKTGLTLASGALLSLVSIIPILFREVQPKTKVRRKQVKDVQTLSEIKLPETNMVPDASIGNTVMPESTPSMIPTMEINEIVTKNKRKIKVE